VLAASVPARAGEVKVSFSNGLVTVIATNATPREILGEWARLGQVRVTNLDRLAGGPVTLQLTNVSEAQALETLLRGTAGYVAAPRREPIATMSLYDRVLLMPGLAPAVPVAGATAQPAANTPVSRGRPGQPPFGMPSDDQTGPMSGFPQAWTTRGAGRPGPNGPAGQSMQSFVAAQPYMDGNAQDQSAAGSVSSSGSPLPSGQPGQAPAGSAARPGEMTAPAPTAVQNTNGPTGQMQPPLVNPAASPYGLTNPAARPAGPPPVNAPAGPIKVPE
jgi:hypothetical protein